MFSFNGAGKCPACKGKGVIVSDMAFMDDIETTCDVCKGLRYSKEVLQYEVDGKNIAEVMDLTVAQAGEFFRGTKISEAAGASGKSRTFLSAPESGTFYFIRRRVAANEVCFLSRK